MITYSFRHPSGHTVEKTVTPEVARDEYRRISQTLAFPDAVLNSEPEAYLTLCRAEHAALKQALLDEQKEHLAKRAETTCVGLTYDQIEKMQGGKLRR